MTGQGGYRVLARYTCACINTEVTFDTFAV
jgi:hypothetical protein